MCIRDRVCLVGVGTGTGGYPTVNTNLPTTLVEDGNIIYFTGSSTNAEGLYRWDGSAYQPGPRVLDFRRTLADGTVETAASDVDSSTYSNAFDVSATGDISLNQRTLGGYDILGNPASGNVAAYLPVSGDYPSTNGVAVENLGSVVHTDASSWPTGGSTVFGITGFDYGVGGGSGDRADIEATLTNNTTGPINYSGGRFDVTITVTSIDSSSGAIEPTLFVGDGTTGIGSATFSRMTEPGTITLSITSLAGDGTLAVGDSLTLFVNENDTNDRPFTYQVDSVQFSLDQTRFQRADVVQWTDATVQDGSIGTPQLADNAVTTSKIADGSVTNTKIPDNTIDMELLRFDTSATEARGRVLTYGGGITDPGFNTIADPIPVISQLLGTTVDLQNQVNAIRQTVNDNTDEIHRIEDASTRATTNFYRSITGINTPPSDTLVDYTTCLLYTSPSPRDS